MPRKVKHDDLLEQMGSHEERRLVDRLRTIGLDKYVELPQIAVMGDTSSGKSSLLSALSGVTFPSSDKLTTRCPTQLILSHDSQFRGSVRLVRFQSTSTEATKELAGMEDVAPAIEKLTAKLVAEGQYISDDQIVIELSGSSLPNLTLTDLPGLVRTVADGEDPGMIHRVRQLVNRYMGQERTIIIAVVPANVDIHNTEILQAAEEADPSGVRTIAVVTKLDLIDEGAESSVYELLLNKKKFMKLGYHAVKCRSQKELNQGVTIPEGTQREKLFFPQHEFWKRLPVDLWGMAALTKKLVEILHNNIRRSLPTVIEEISERIDAAEKELAGLGSALNSPSARRQQFGQWASKYLRQMEAAVLGVQSNHMTSFAIDDGVDEDGETIRLRSTLREKEREFQEVIELIKEFGVGSLAKPKSDVAEGDPVLVTNGDGTVQDGIVKTVHALASIDCEYAAMNTTTPMVFRYNQEHWKYNNRPVLEKFIRDNRGDELPIFTSYQVFCRLYRRWVELWESPTLSLLRDYRMQTKAASELVITELSAAPNVDHYFRLTASTVMNRLSQAAEREAKGLLRSECRPYTQDKSLFSERDRRREQLLKEQTRAGETNVGEVKKEETLSSEELEVIETEVALYAYLAVAIRRFVDVIPMRLNDLVLRAFLVEMERELLGTTDEQLERLLQESSRTRQRRAQLTGEIETLRDAKDEIELVFY